jgi:putative lipoprotein
VSDHALRAWLQRWIPAAPEGSPDQPRYAAAFADLNGDGVGEALVYVIGPTVCGSGGCNLLVLQRSRTGWLLVTQMTITNPPIRLLPTGRHGWRDLGVFVAGGGFRGHEAVLSFNGRSYPTNPSVPPARATPRPGPGQVLIAREDEGVPIFP